MPDELVNELRRKEAELAALHRELAARRKRLATLHQELGFESVEDLIDALQGSPRSSSRFDRRASIHGRVTKSMRADIETALLRGEEGTALAKQFGISYPTLHRIKERLGLVKKKRPRVGKKRKNRR